MKCEMSTNLLKVKKTNINNNNKKPSFIARVLLTGCFFFWLQMTDTIVATIINAVTLKKNCINNGVCDLNHTAAIIFDDIIA